MHRTGQEMWARVCIRACARVYVCVCVCVKLLSHFQYVLKLNLIFFHSHLFWHHVCLILQKNNKNG